MVIFPNRTVTLIKHTIFIHSVGYNWSVFSYIFYVLLIVAPIKALCSERYADWNDKFGPLGLTCCELTGDTEMDDYFELQRAHIITTTPVGL